MSRKLRCGLIWSCTVLAISLAAQDRPSLSSRSETIRQAQALYEQGNIGAARDLLIELTNRDRPTLEVVTMVGRLFSESKDLQNAAIWFGRAVQMSEGHEDETRENIRLLLARTLWKLGREGEALPHLAAAGKHHTFRESSTFTPEGRSSERNADGRESFVTFAEALERAGMPEAARPYRLVAAAGTFKAGLWAIRAGENQKCLEYFAEAEQILPLESFPVAVRMTVLRDMVMVYGRTGRFAQGVVALDRLFELCKPRSPGWSCPDEGVASAPFSGSTFAYKIEVNGKTLRPLVEIHLRILTKFAERAFVSVSWDPASLALRADSRDHEFLGEEVGFHATPTNLPQGVARCVVAGTPYAKATGSEEDRVEFERCWATWRESPDLQNRLRDEWLMGHYRLVIKGLLSEIELAARLAAIRNVATGEDRDVASFRLSDLRKRIGESTDEPAKTAFEVAEHLLRIIEKAKQWPLTQ
jgi:hypothetical protein